MNEIIKPDTEIVISFSGGKADRVYVQAGIHA